MEFPKTLFIFKILFPPLRIFISSLKYFSILNLPFHFLPRHELFHSPRFPCIIRNFYMLHRLFVPENFKRRHPFLLLLKILLALMTVIPIISPLSYLIMMSSSVSSESSAWLGFLKLMYKTFTSLSYEVQILGYGIIQAEELIPFFTSASAISFASLQTNSSIFYPLIVSCPESMN